MHVGSEPPASHVGVEKETFLGVRGSGVTLDHGVPVEDGGLGDPVEDQAGGVDVRVGVEGVGSEDSAGDIRIADEAQGDSIGVELIHFFYRGGFLEEGEIRVAGKGGLGRGGMG